MQLFFETSDENSNAKGLNFFNGKVKKIVSKNCRLPLLGWYEISSFQKEMNKKTFSLIMDIHVFLIMIIL